MIVLYAIIINKTRTKAVEYKISEVVAKTGVPKSTILYYIKERLLPEAKKIKPNVHKYSDEHIELLHYIKYMQESFGSSIEQIKQALKRKNDSFSGSYTMLAPLMNTLSGEEDQNYYTKEELLEQFDIDATLLENLLEDEIILPIKEGFFSKKDASIVALVENFLEVGVDYSILKAYITHAKELAKLELELQKSLCDVKSDENFTTLWKILFETLFNAKPYLFNRSTYKLFHQSLVDELGSK